MNLTSLFIKYNLSCLIKTHSATLLLLSYSIFFENPKRSSQSQWLRVASYFSLAFHIFLGFISYSFWLLVIFLSFINIAYTGKNPLFFFTPCQSVTSPSLWLLYSFLFSFFFFRSTLLLLFFSFFFPFFSFLLGWPSSCLIFGRTSSSRCRGSRC